MSHYVSVWFPVKERGIVLFVLENRKFPEFMSLGTALAIPLVSCNFKTCLNIWVMKYFKRDK